MFPEDHHATFAIIWWISANVDTSYWYWYWSHRVVSGRVGRCLELTGWNAMPPVFRYLVRNDLDPYPSLTMPGFHSIPMLGVGRSWVKSGQLCVSMP